MLLTHAERQKRYREKQKEKYGEKAVQEKESKRRNAKTLENIDLYREKDRLRKQKSRQKAGKTTTCPGYQSLSTLSKAVKKAKSALPNSPRKRAMMVKRLSSEAGCQEATFPLIKQGGTALSKELKAAVIEFYMRDDISRQAPGKRDTVAVRENNERKTMQKRHLSMNLSEVYQLFKQENHNKKIGNSKFSSLRPGHMQLSSQMPRNVCVYRHHQNMILILEALHKLDETFPVYSHELPQTLVSSDHSDFFWNNICENYKGALLFKSLYSLNYLDDDKNVEWYQWEKGSWAKWEGIS